MKSKFYLPEDNHHGHPIGAISRMVPDALIFDVQDFIIVNAFEKLIDRLFQVPLVLFLYDLNSHKS